MAHKSTDQNKRSKNPGGGRRNRNQIDDAAFSNDGVYGNRTSYLKRSEKYTPGQLTDIAPKLQLVQIETPEEPKLSKDKKPHKTKFVNLYGDHGRERQIMLPGRNECNCQASIHGLVNNCLKCGRIVCEQEGSGGCFFCGSLVCSKEEQKSLDQGGRKAEDLRAKLLLLPPPKSTATRKEEEFGEKETTSTKKATVVKHEKMKTSPISESASSSNKDFDKGLEKAKAEKDRLLEYQQNSARRTMVYDDESDYFDTGANPWLTKEEREKLRTREQELRALQNVPRSQRKFTLDVAGRRIIQEEPQVDMYNPNDAVIQEVYYTRSQDLQADIDALSCDFDDIHRPDFYRPTYNAAVGHIAVREQSGTNGLLSMEITSGNRLQDGTLESLRDQGRCLSMHQPYASLLVMGIKKHEGRTWYTTHRGPLWIASTAKKTPKEEIDQVEQFYRFFYNGALPRDFPSQYPPSCLLGCVDVVDCLPQEQYQERFPGGESESPYVWICENAKELSAHFPIRGQHKIYKLDPTIHQAAKKLIGK